MTTRRRAKAVKKTVDTSRIIIGTEDMVLLQSVNEDGIVANLTMRLQTEEIYTNIGHVLVACNPYKWLPIYSDEYIKKYIHQQRVDVVPHIFATAEAAYRAMITEEENQCVIISGESGAGKTEASKQIQNYIAAVCGGGESVEKIKKAFLESNPVLEAFGNAKTLRNNNSSRFGKYFELKFNRFGCPQGGVVTNYLLEKSRICKPGNGERNFHIFYQLLASDYTPALFLDSSPQLYDYLSCSNTYSVDGIVDKEEMSITIAAMRNVGMSNKIIQSILSLLAAVLHLGNIKFQSIQIDGAEGSIIKDKTPLQHFCNITKIDSNLLIQSLTFRELQTMAPGGKVDVYQVPQSPTQARARRDAVAKAVYSNLFDLIVSRINITLSDNNTTTTTTTTTSNEDDMLSISVLDIYGFEVFKSNGFEQLCINYVNEKLQQIFIELTLRTEQDEYQSEGITWKTIPFFNNKVVCDLLDASRPCSGVFRILDDTCKTMHGTSEGTESDRKFIETCAQVHGSNPHYQTLPGSGFVLKHYAGEVTYSIGKFVESNKDSLNKDLLLMIKSSQDPLLGHLFPEEVDLNDKKAAPTGSNRIRLQCSALVTSLMGCSPHYIRCIKSNDEKKALTVDAQRVKHQVKYLGLVENIKVRRAGYAYRAEYHRFLERFCMLSPQTYPEYRGADIDGCRVILNNIGNKKLIPGLTKDEVQFGKTKIFIRTPETYFAMERLLEIRRGDFAASIQRAWRKYKSQKEFNLLSSRIARLYRTNAKSRRRDSIFRPYIGDYLCELPTQIMEPVREGIFRIIDHYDESENIKFVDSSCATLHSKGKDKDPFTLDKTLIVVTNKAIYLCYINPQRIEKPPNNDSNRELSCQLGAVETKNLPQVILRRRILIGSANENKEKIPRQYAQLQSLSLSKLADESLCLKLKTMPILPKPYIQHWVPDASQNKCALTGKEFTVFSRRHHCRACGNIYQKEVCDYKQPLPDLGHYVPVKVCDLCIGLESTEGVEDILLLSARRSELVSVLQSTWGKTGLPSDLRSVDLPVVFQNNLKLDKSSSAAGGGGGGLSRLIGPEVAFCEVDIRIPYNPAGNFIPGFNISISIEKDRVNISTAPGLSHDVVEKKEKAQAMRMKMAAERRKKEEMERSERRKIKEAQRENDRLLRLAEKKAKKQLEKQSIKSENDSVKIQSATQAVALKFANLPKKQTESSKLTSTVSGPTSSVSSELAAKMAKRRSLEI